jgi:aspartate/methionine/tyrosine aminotransferase
MTAGIRFISDEIYHGLDYAFPAVTAAELSDHALVINSFSKYFCMTGWRVGWMVVPEATGAAGRTAAAKPLHLGADAVADRREAAFEGREEMEAIKRGYEENRRILIEGLPRAGLTKFLPADGAFYLYADVSDFTADSFAFAGQMLEKAHVAATPGVDFDPCTAGPSSASRMRARPTRCARRWRGLRAGSVSAANIGAEKYRPPLTPPGRLPLASCGGTPRDQSSRERSASEGE